jgi:hypothetical protein
MKIVESIVYVHNMNETSIWALPENLERLASYTIHRIFENLTETVSITTKFTTNLV